ncbi:MAG: hypothetical protein RL033_3768, partial [Pseudomonadota bacterium]
NLDQFLATEAIDRSGAGISVKARQANVIALRSALERGLADSALGRAAQQVATRFAQQDSGAAFRALVEAVSGGDLGQAHSYSR